MLTIKVNNKEYQFTEQSVLQEVISKLKIPLNGVAVAVNETIVSKSDWSTTILHQNDNVLVITATQGG